MTETEQELIARWIEPDPHLPDPAEVRVRGTGIHVWAIVGQWQAADRDVAAVAQDYELPIEAVEAALAYYRRQQCLIDARLAANQLSVA
jgi:uncharacterized protein (DUF433 family)